MFNIKKRYQSLGVFFLFLSFLIGVNTSYALPLSIVPTSMTTLPSQMQPGRPVMAYYTVTNQTKYAQRNIYVKYLPSQVIQVTSQTTFPKTCGQSFHLSPQESCILQLMIMGEVLASNPDPKQHLFVCLKGGITCVGPSTALNVGLLQSSIPLFTAVGSVYLWGDGYGPPSPNPVGPYGPPLLVQSVNDGNTWSMMSPPGFPVYGGLYSTSCTGFGMTGLCVAAGEDDTADATTSPGIAKPLLLQTQDGGGRWEVMMSSMVAPITNLPVAGFFHGVSCTGTGSTAVCIGVGEDDTNLSTVPNATKTATPLLVISTNGGASWAVSMSSAISPIPNLPTYGVFNAVSCSGNGLTAVCIAVGEDDTHVVTDNGNGAVPLLVQSTDGGRTWVVISSATINQVAHSTIPWTGVLNSVSCSGEQLMDTICVSSGSLGTPENSIPLIINTTIGLSNWAVPTILNLPNKGFISGASCASGARNARCVVAGQDSTKATPMPLLVASVDGARSWSMVSLPQKIASGYYNSVSCTGQGSETSCIAVGRDNSGYVPQPLLVESHDGINLWSMISVPISPLTSAVFNTASCSGNGIKPICIAAGNTGDDNIFIEPLLMTNIGSLRNWVVAQIPGMTEKVPYGVFGSSTN